MAKRFRRLVEVERIADIDSLLNPDRTVVIPQEVAIVAGGSVVAGTLAFFGFRSKAVRYARNPNPPLRYVESDRVQGWDILKARWRVGAVAKVSDGFDRREKYQVKWDGEATIDPAWHDVASLYLEGTISE